MLAVSLLGTASTGPAEHKHPHLLGRPGGTPLAGAAAPPLGRGAPHLSPPAPRCCAGCPCPLPCWLCCSGSARAWQWQLGERHSQRPENGVGRRQRGGSFPCVGPCTGGQRFTEQSLRRLRMCIVPRTGRASAVSRAQLCKPARRPSPLTWISLPSIQAVKCAGRDAPTAEARCTFSMGAAAPKAASKRRQASAVHVALLGRSQPV